VNYLNLIRKFKFAPKKKNVFFYYLMTGFFYFFLTSNVTSQVVDSSLVTPPTSLAPKYVGTISAPPTISNERYDQLSACPATISGCADINGNGGNSGTCPDYCTVTRTPTTVTAGLGPVPTSKDAICPGGYSNVGMYNMQTELIYNSSPATIYPVLGTSNYSSYINASYSCARTGSLHTSSEYCHSAPYSYGQIADNVNNQTSNYVVQIGNTSSGQASYRSRCSCKGSCLTCSCAVASDDVWVYYYSYVQCTPPAGIYSTSNMAPVSAVCARTKSTWLTLTPGP
jgi:hypothetical protein